MEYLTKHKNLFILLILLVPIGLGTKFYNGNNYFWINNSFSDVIYEIFWSILLFLLIPKMKLIVNIATIFIATSIIEFLQLVKTPYLLKLRSSFLGKTLLGTTFVPMDFVYYAIGCVLSFVILLIHTKSVAKTNNQLHIKNN